MSCTIEYLADTDISLGKGTVNAAQGTIFLPNVCLLFPSLVTFDSFLLSAVN